MNYNPQIIALAAATLLNFSCTDDPTSGNLAVKASAQYANISTGRNVANVQLSKFVVNIREIELEYDNDFDEDTDTLENEEHLYNDIELEGPFVLDLLQSTGQFTVANVNLPFDTYNEIEFDMHKNQDSSNEEMFGKSILIEGTIDGVPFIFWHDTEEEFEVDYENTANDIIVSEGGAGIVINFDLNLIFGSTSAIDFSNAVDGNQNGIIEIHPGDEDGNGDYADLIKNLLHDVSDLLDD